MDLVHVHCETNLLFHFYVNGGAPQLVTVTSTRFTDDANGIRDSGWIPFNVRSASSIRVQIERPGFPAVIGDTPCVVSWALD